MELAAWGTACCPAHAATCCMSQPVSQAHSPEEPQQQQTLCQLLTGGLETAQQSPEQLRPVPHASPAHLQLLLRHRLCCACRVVHCLLHHIEPPQVVVNLGQRLDHQTTAAAAAGSWRQSSNRHVTGTASPHTCKRPPACSLATPWVRPPNFTLLTVAPSAPPPSVQHSMEAPSLPGSL